MANVSRQQDNQGLDALLNPHRTEERERMRAVGMERLRSLGIRLTGTETSDEVGVILDAVDAFEHAVESRGGDLLVDEGPRGVTREPDDPAFVLPRRAAHEPASVYAMRLEYTAARLHRRPLKYR